MTTLMQAHRQWMSRAPDERFTSLHDMQDFKGRLRDNSRSQVISSRGLTVRPVEDDARALQIMGYGNGLPRRRRRIGRSGSLQPRQPRQFAGELLPREPDACSDDRGLPQLQSALHPRRRRHRRPPNHERGGQCQRAPVRQRP